MKDVTIKQLVENYTVNGTSLTAIEWGNLIRIAQKCGLNIGDAGKVEKPAGQKGKAANIYTLPENVTFTFTEEK